MAVFVWIKLSPGPHLRCTLNDSPMGEGRLLSGWKTPSGCGTSPVPLAGNTMCRGQPGSEVMGREPGLMDISIKRRVRLPVARRDPTHEHTHSHYFTGV